MPGKWDINKAVRASGLAAPARLIMLTLSDLADAKTAVIPEEHGPSLREIAEMTGLSKATVIRHLNELESLGWMDREKPTLEAARREHARTGYRLATGRNPEGGMSQSETSHVSQKDMPGGNACLTERQEHVSEEDMGMSQSETVPYSHDHYQIKQPSSSAKPRKKAPKKPRKPKRSPEPHRADVEKICDHLVDRIVANGSKPPSISKTWRDEARLLLDKDGRTVEQVLKAIDWCQADPFWRSNILSMPTLRKKYDQLRLAAQRKSARASPNGQLTEVNGMHLKPANVEAIARQQRMQALQDQLDTGQQLAIGST